MARPIFVAAPPLLPPGSTLLLLDLTPRSAWADVGWFVALAILAELLIDGMVRVAAAYLLGMPEDPSEEWMAELRRKMLLPTVGMRALGWTAIVTVLIGRRGQSFRSVGLHSANLVADVPIGMAAVLVAYGLILAILSVVTVSWPGIDKPGENAERIMAFVPKLAPWQFVPLAGLIGLYEELVFRGFLLPRLRRAAGSWILAVLLTTVVFVALHAFDQTVTALIVVTLLSLLFSGLTIWRRSIVAAVVAHALFDLSQFLVLYWFAGDQWK